MKNLAEHCPKNRNEWRAWLEKNHQSTNSVWLVFYKKKSPNYNLSWSDAVDEALCFGWIDSTKKTIDHEKYKQYFCKRKPKSNWSKVNKDKVDQLISQNLMTAAGAKSVAVAKENGSWTFLDEVEALIVPEDLQKEFENYENADKYFQAFSNSTKKLLLYWVLSAKRDETRQKRIFEIAESANKNLKPKNFV